MEFEPRFPPRHRETRAERRRRILLAILMNGTLAVAILGLVAIVFIMVLE